MSASRVRVGVSACLLGEEVRWDGGHKRSAFLTDQLGPHVEYVTVCPEVELGLGVPRPTLRLERRDGEVRMVEPRTGADRTDAMRAFSTSRVEALRKLDLCGFILKRDSPSCGLYRVKVYDGEGPARRDGRGLFAEALQEACPELPMEEEGRLQDDNLRAHFVERVFALRRLRDHFEGDWDHRTLIRFHTAHKLQLLAHSPKAYAELGRLVAEAHRLEPEEVRARYEQGFLRGLAEPGTPGRHTNVLEHILGYLRDHLDPAARAELREWIHGYRTGRVPLVTPVALLGHHVRRLGIEYLEGQVYLDPHPRSLELRSRT